MDNNNILDYVTLTQAASALGYANSTALRAMCRGSRIFGAVKAGKTWLIPRSWVDNELKNPTLAAQGGRGSSRK